MRVFRLGLIIGLAIGYVLGTRAGTERYQQIERLGRKLWRSEQAQQLSGQIREAANRAGSVLEERASEGITKVSSLARGGNGDSSESSS